MKGSDSLPLPSITGGFRTPTVLNKPFADVAREIGLGIHFTQRGMRRTYNDLMRAAGVNTVVLKSVSGHLTDDMVEHYSSVRGDEQRESIGKVIDLMEEKASRTKRAPSASLAAR